MISTVDLPLYFLLMSPQILKNSAVLAEGLKRSLVGDSAVLKDIDVVKFGQKMQTVKRGDNRLTAKFFKQTVINLHLRFGVNAARWLIQKHNVTASGGQYAPR